MSSPVKKSTIREPGTGNRESRVAGGWPTITNVNGITVSEPAASDNIMYKRYSEISSLAAPRRYGPAGIGADHKVMKSNSLDVVLNSKHSQKAKVDRWLNIIHSIRFIFNFSTLQLTIQIIQIIIPT